MDVYIDPSGVLLLIGLLGLLVLAALWAPDPAAEHDSPSTLEEPGNADWKGDRQVPPASPGDRVQTVPRRDVEAAKRLVVPWRSWSCVRHSTWPGRSGRIGAVRSGGVRCLVAGSAT